MKTIVFYTLTLQVKHEYFCVLVTVQNWLNFEGVGRRVLTQVLGTTGHHLAC